MDEFFATASEFFDVLDFFLDILDLPDKYRLVKDLTSATFAASRSSEWNRLDAVALAPTISSVSPSVLNTSTIRKPFTVTGTGFTSSSTLLFNAGGGDIPSTAADFLQPNTPTQIQYNLAVGTVPATWTVKVVNGGVPSLPYTFSVIQVGAVLTGLSITGPGTVNENLTGQFTAKALFSNGTTPDVTTSTTWNVISGPASINSSTGLLSAQSVSGNTTATVTASYTSGGVTKTQTVSTTIVDTGGGGGGSTTQELITNGGFEQGATGWSATDLSGTGISTGIVNLSYPRTYSWYAYLGNRDNALGSVHQFITIPANATSVVLSFYLNVVTNESAIGSPPFDVMDVNLRTSSDSLIRKLTTYSEADKGSNINGNYTQKVIDLTPYIGSYKGQTILLQFYVDTDGLKSTIFRIDDVSVTATVPVPATLTELKIAGPTQVQENQSAQYYATAIFSNGTTSDVTTSTTWSIANGPASINSSTGLLGAESVSGNTPATVAASYTSGGVTRTKEFLITILNVAPPLVSLEITGPTIFNEKTTQQYTATAYYGDGTNKVVTSSCNWSSDNGQVPVSNGSVTVGDLAADVVATLFADYSENGTTQSTRLSVKAQDVPVPVTLTSLDIAGPAATNENSSAQYTATAQYSNGSSQVVVANWLEDSTATTISIFGLLSAGEVAANTTVSISASYTEGSVTKNAAKSVTINDVPDTTKPVLTITSPLDGTTVTSASLPVSGSASDGGLGNHGISSVTVKGVSAAGGSATGAGAANWSATVTLSPGPNTITVFAKDGANNSTSKSITVTFGGLPKPVPTTLPPLIVTSDNAVLTGTVKPSGSATTAHFEYGTTTSYGSATPDQVLGSGTAAVPIQAIIGDLLSNKTYHYRVVASNSGGTAAGADQSFVTNTTSNTDKATVGNWSERTVVRTLPTTVGGTVNIGTLTFTGGTGSIEAAVNASGNGWSVAKRYVIPVRYNLGNGSPPATWLKVLPTHDTGPYGVNDFDLDIYVSLTTTWLRLRTVGSTSVAATARIAIKTIGLQTFTNSSTTTPGVAAPAQTIAGNAVEELLGKAGIGVAPAGNAVLDVNGGDTRGLRLRVRTTAGAPNTGTWSKGTMILDKDGNLYICTATSPIGTPAGTWKKVGN